MDLTCTGINDSLCTYYKMLWRKCKSITMDEQINPLILGNEQIHQTENCSEWSIYVITHLIDLKELFPGNELLSDKV